MVKIPSIAFPRLLTGSSDGTGCCQLATPGATPAISGPGGQSPEDGL